MFKDKSYLNKDTIILYEKYPFIRPGRFYIYKFKRYHFFRSTHCTKAIFSLIDTRYSYCHEVNFSERELQNCLNTKQIILTYGGI